MAKRFVYGVEVTDYNFTGHMCPIVSSEASTIS